VGYKERGIASFYGVKFHNYKTSNGEIYNMYGMTAANKVLPLPTYVRVTNLENHKQVIVRVNDRGPFHVNRIIDLSFAAAKKLDMIKTGTALVEVEAIDPRQPEPTAKPAVLVTHAASTNTSAKPVIYLQLGAFSTNAAAERFEQRIRQYTQRPIRIVAGASQGLAIYRVQVGPVASVDEADALTATFKQHGLGDAFAVVD
ncbi:MAG: septal ring lytic transglycosylase RlpA family protein, partial [Gammaproteobacteria bacterium]|nr:septal ring lytic transglycosylase RlpA family protein [Gammaproteobacteria bacterium]